MGQFLNFITKDFMEGITEPWCNNQGVVVLPFIKKNSKYYFLLIKEKNPLFKDLTHTELGSLTGGVEKLNLLDTVKSELLEETGIDIRNNKLIPIYDLGNYYANKTNIKLWHFYAVDLTKLELELTSEYKGFGDGSIGETDISGQFIAIEQLTNSNDALALAVFAKLILQKIIVY